MQLVTTGIHQRTAHVELRERLAFDDATLGAALRELRLFTSEACILSTCNRVEVFALMDDEADPSELALFFADWHHLDANVIAPHLFVKTGEDAVRHMFRLAAGLDSMVIGEEQILGQIRTALQAATDADALGPHLRRMIESALAAGKLARTKTNIARLNLSVVSVAVDLAHQSVGTFDQKRVLVVGAGRMAELAIKHLHGVVAELTVTNRTACRAAVLAERYGVQHAPFEQLATLLHQHDIVVSCTASPGPVFHVEQIAQAAAGRAHPLVLLDLAVPRDIDPEAAALPNVLLFDVDAMQAISAANRAARAAEIGTAEALVCIEVEKFMAWWASQRIVPTIRALRERAEEIRAAEVQRTLARLPHLGPSEQAAIGALSAAIVNKLLHTPIASLKNPHDSDDLVMAVQRLFQL